MTFVESISNEQYKNILSLHNGFNELNIALKEF